MRKPSSREWLLLALVPALILAGAHAERQGADPRAAVVQARVAASGPGREHAAGGPALRLEPSRRDARPVRPQDVFASKSWIVAPPPAPAPAAQAVPVVRAPPEPPSAPPLPFTYLGRYADAGQPVFFLVRGDRILTVHQGDVIDGTYRIEGLVGSLLGLTYLPLNQRQHLDTGPG